MYVVVNRRWRVIHIWLGKESKPEPETGVLVVRRLTSIPNRQPEADGCWWWGVETPLGSRAAVRLIIPTVFFTLVRIVHRTYHVLLSKHPSLCLLKKFRHRILCRGSAVLISRTRSRFFQSSHRRLHRLPSVFLMAGTTLSPVFCSFMTEQNSAESRHFERDAPAWEQSDGTEQLLSFARQNFTEWSNKERLKMNQPFSAHVGLLRPFDQSRYGLLPLYDLFSRRFNLRATIPSAEVLVFTTSRSWQKLHPVEDCPEGSVFIFTRDDKFAALLFRDQGEAHAPILLQAVIPVRESTSLCAQRR